jgi:hypothetical protein
MFLSKVKFLSAGCAVLTLALSGLTGVASAQAPLKGYAYQEWLRSQRGSPTIAPAPLVVSPAAPSDMARSGPPLAAPVTAPSAPAVTGDAAATPAGTPPVVIWYEYVPSLRGWVEHRGTATPDWRWRCR